MNAPVFPLGAAAVVKGPVADDCCAVLGTLFTCWREVPLVMLLVAAAAAAPAAKGAEPAGCLRQKRPLEAAAGAVVGAALGLLANAGDE